MALFLSLLAGGLVGLFYFGGLWLTLRWLTQVSAPALLIMGSFMLRTAVAVTAFYLIAADWTRLLAAVAGFLLARVILVRRWGSEKKHGH
jgi:F1F0 ATPase subunit 2